ncbi:MAG: isovaleryl-CoA dehydrogenase, partial [Betaproteobacteria bacterium]|nr:isovaleryl-CoA dehydrogenase [Betaproteobacteria bacterium]
MLSAFTTHEVTNQPPALTDINWYRADAALQQGVAHFGAAWAEEALNAYGALTGGEMIALGFAANENKPKFKPFDRFGHRIDQVEFHPAYHRLMALGVEHGVSNFTWRHADRKGANVARAALMYLHTQADQGTSCPLTMTYASVPVLKQQDLIAREWLPLILSPHYDERFLPADQKRGVTLGMGMTEKQGGSDVRSNTTRATPLDRAGPGEWYTLVGHKWFFSAPMCDAFLVLAQAERGISCFLMPRFKPDGEVNAIRIQRLKDKLGDWSNASSEVDFHNAHAQLIGEEGRGVATILEMVALTRQDCMIGSSGIMRQALVQAIHHARHRKTFGKLLIDQPLMRQVLADLVLESEAALALTLRVAHDVGRAPHDAQEAAFARVATAIGKYWICKRCPPFVNEAQECLGGAGYVEESILPRLYRQAPLNSIWEGSGNIQCLDVLRALAREPGCKEALFAEFATVSGTSGTFDSNVVALQRALEDIAHLESRARMLVERMALLLQAAQLMRTQQTAAVAFIEARLGVNRAALFGASLIQADAAALI